MATELQTLRAQCFIETKKALQIALHEDHLIIRAKEMVDDLHKTTNTLAKRLREWTNGYLPELDALKDHEQYVEYVATLSSDEILSRLHRKESIGTPISDLHKAEIVSAALVICELYKEKERLMQYIERSLVDIMPNTLAMCGAAIAADLLVGAGSLSRLSRLPSGTIQLLGAETALFRHLKNRRISPPKHGLIFNHPLLQAARKADRGKVARALADKIAIAAKVDYFKGEPCGDKLRKELEARFQ